MTEVITRTAGTYAHAAGTTEDTAITISSTQNNKILGIWLDMTNLTQTTTVRVKYQIDGTTARTFQTIVWTTAMDDGILIEGNIPVDDSVTVTVQSGTTEGASRNIPYEYWTEGLGAGAVTFTYTLNDQITGLPIANANIWITSDSAGDNVIATGITDSSGVITAYLDAGTVYVWRAKNGVNFTNPDTESVA